MKRFVFTPLSILLLVLLSLAGSVAINGIFIDNKGGNALGGGIGLMFFIVFGGILLIEQKIIAIYKQYIKRIRIAELILIALIAATLIISDFEFSVG